MNHPGIGVILANRICISVLNVAPLFLQMIGIGIAHIAAAAWYKEDIMALNHGFEKAIVRDTLVDLIATLIMIVTSILLAIFHSNSLPIIIVCGIVATIQVIVGIVQTKDLVLAIKNLRKKQKEWQNYGK